MRAARIAIVLVIGGVYLWYTMMHPENTWPARGVAILALIAAGFLFRKAGAPAGDPMTPEAVQSLNLAGRQLDGNHNAEPAPRSPRSE